MNSRAHLVKQLTKHGFPVLADHVRHGTLPGNPNASLCDIEEFATQNFVSPVPAAMIRRAIEREQE